MSRFWWRLRDRVRHPVRCPYCTRRAAELGVPYATVHEEFHG